MLFTLVSSNPEQRLTLTGAETLPPPPTSPLLLPRVELLMASGVRHDDVPQMGRLPPSGRLGEATNPSRTGQPIGTAAPAAPAEMQMVRYGAPVSADARKVLGLDDDPTAPTPPMAGVVDPMAGVRASDIPSVQSCVDSMPLIIQRGFRFKMMGLLVLQLFFILVGSATLVFADVVISQNTFTLLFLTMGTLLLAMWTLKNRYPLNYVLYALFTLAATAFLGGGSIYFRSSANFQILGYTTVNVAALFQLSLRTTKNEFNEDVLLDWNEAYKWAYFAMLLVAVPVQVFLSPGSWGHFLSSVLFASLFTFWFRYDAEKMCETLSPDDYMMGFLSMWADFFSVIAICATMCCLCGAGGGDGGGEAFSGGAEITSATV